MKVIKLVYWHNEISNYGDLLSPYLIGKLSDCKIVQKNYFVGNWKSHLYHTIYSLVHFDWGFRCRYHLPFEKTLIGIGSILYTGNTISDIWGAGFMSTDEKCNGGTIYALRGKNSLAMIKKQIADGDQIKLNEQVALGDPALLLPLVVSPSVEKKYKVGIIPHFSEVDFFIRNYSNRFHIIDLRSTDIEGVTNDITSCERIFSTSLHGIIVAHAYGIPALWMEYTGLENHTKGFKFRDYFSSVEIDEYIPVKDIARVLSDEATAIAEFENRSMSCLPIADLSTIRKSLLEVAPFKIVIK